jgi:hypothetical protein
LHLLQPIQQHARQIGAQQIVYRRLGHPAKGKMEPQKASSKLKENKLYATMRDCEIVLRYFAFLDIEKNFKGGVKRTLDTFMQSNDVSLTKEVQPTGKRVSPNLRHRTTDIWRPAFRLPNAQGELLNRRSIPLADAVLVAVKAHRHHSSKIIARSNRIIVNTKKLLTKTRPTKHS